jgi:hypothetical protein
VSKPSGLVPAHVWTLSWFDRVEDHLVGSEDFPLLSDAEVARILAVSPDDVWGGEFPIDATRAARFRMSTGYRVDVDQFDYFLGATAPSSAL